MIKEQSKNNNNIIGTDLRASTGSLQLDKSRFSKQHTEEKSVFQELGIDTSLLLLWVKTQRDARRDVRDGQPRNMGSHS